MREFDRSLVLTGQRRSVNRPLKLLTASQKKSNEKLVFAGWSLPGLSFLLAGDSSSFSGLVSTSYITKKAAIMYLQPDSTASPL